ncbi:MAG TPA: hypothetical protein DIT25_04565 [Candidatus Moranbacteria bacterium]|nr:hypothetical protein [Candidatus Moranbacteria bacterium]
MYPKTIDKKTKSVLEKIKKTDWTSDFYLAGGTALALQLGHRESIDLDFFSKKGFSLQKIKESLAQIGQLAVDYEDEGTLSGVLDGVKISFFRYDYALLFPYLEHEGVRLADERDIAGMKVDTISARGSKKDFADIYFLMKKYSLPQLIGFFEEKYKNVQYNKLHILKSLAYFDDADADPSPLMLVDFDWEKAKEEIGKEAEKVVANS